MDSLPPEQFFSSELIYQVSNIVRRFNKQVHSDRSSSNYGTSVDSFFNKDTISDFYFVQHIWPHPSQIKEIGTYFHYMTYVHSDFNFNSESGRRKIQTLHKSLRDESVFWDDLLNRITSCSGNLRTINSCNNYVMNLRKISDTSSINPQELHYNLLKLYSFFPVQNGVEKQLYDIHLQNMKQDNRLRYSYYVILNRENPANLKIWRFNHYASKKEPSDIDRMHREHIHFLDPKDQKINYIFYKYLFPLFIEPKPDFDEALGIHSDEKVTAMLWLPIYDQSTDFFQGYFKGWLFQILSKEENIIENTYRYQKKSYYINSYLDEGVEKRERIINPAGYYLNKEFFKAIGRYAARSLRQTNSLVMEFNHLLTDEIVERSQDILDIQCSEALERNLHLFGGWKSIKLNPPNSEIPFRKIYKDNNGNLKIDVTLNPQPLKYESSRINIDKIKEDPKILSLEFEDSFSIPNDEDSSYYDALVAQIYSIYNRLKYAKWVEMESQKSGRFVEAQEQLRKWAHALRTKLSGLTEFKDKLSLKFKEGKNLEIDEKSCLNVKNTIDSLNTTINVLSSNNKFLDFFQEEKETLPSFYKLTYGKDPCNKIEFSQYPRGLAHLLLETFSLMKTKVVLSTGQYASLSDKLPSLKAKCDTHSLPLLKTNELTDYPVTEEELKAFFSNDDETLQLNFILPTTKSIKSFRIWKKIFLYNNAVPTVLEYDVTLSIIIDEMLSNACKYVHKPNITNKASISIELSIESENTNLQNEDMLWAVFKITNTATEIESGDLKHKKETKSKGLGFLINEELCKTLTGDENNFKVLCEKNVDGITHVVSMVKFPVIYVS